MVTKCSSAVDGVGRVVLAELKEALIEEDGTGRMPNATEM